MKWVGKYEGEEIEFETEQAPVWGGFYFTDGDLYAYNTGFGGMPDPSGPFTDYIARPGGDLNVTFNSDLNPTPEPATLTLLGIGLLGGAAFRKRFKWLMT